MVVDNVMKHVVNNCVKHVVNNVVKNVVEHVVTNDVSKNCEACLGRGGKVREQCCETL